MPSLYNKQHFLKDATKVMKKGNKNQDVRVIYPF